MFQQVKRRGLLYRLWFYAERRFKETCFDCSSCGQCVLRSVALNCPMQCPKQLRNGPCGGSMDGKCEVFRERRCVWTQTYRRVDRFPIFKAKFGKILPSIDWSLFGSSAWLNIWPEKKISSSGYALTGAPKPNPNRWARVKGHAGCGCGNSECKK